MGDALQVSLGLLEDTDYTNLTTEGPVVHSLPCSCTKSSSCTAVAVEGPKELQDASHDLKNWKCPILGHRQVSQIRSNR